MFVKKTDDCVFSNRNVWFKTMNMHYPLKKGYGCQPEKHRNNPPTGLPPKQLRSSRKTPSPWARLGLRLTGEGAQGRGSRGPWQSSLKANGRFESQASQPRGGVKLATPPCPLE